MPRFILASWLSSVYFVTLTSCIQSTQAATDSWVARPVTGRYLLAESDHKYEVHDVIKLYANKVGPFSNPR